MPWSRKFTKPIVLKDGHKIATIGDARDLMASLAAGLQDDPDWNVAGDLLQTASIRHEPHPLSRARSRMIRMLKREGLI
jgi:hypothetical protein